MFDAVSSMALSPEQIENLRRSVAMIPSSGLSAGQAAAILTQLAEVTEERDRLIEELNEAGLA